MTPYLFASTTNPTMETLMTKSKSQATKMAQDASDAGRDSFEAFIKSSSIFAKGFEDIMRTSVSLAQSAAEKQARFAKAAMSSKTINEWTEIQTKIAQENFDDFMAGATKISELSVKLMNEASEPLNDQMSKGIKKASDSMAA
jgi:phasin family protein